MLGAAPKPPMPHNPVTHEHELSLGTRVDSRDDYDPDLYAEYYARASRSDPVAGDSILQPIGEPARHRASIEQRRSGFAQRWRSSARLGHLFLGKRKHEHRQ